MEDLEHKKFKKKVQEAIDKNGFSCDLSGEVQWGIAHTIFNTTNGFQKSNLSHEEIQAAFDTARDTDIKIQKNRSKLKDTLKNASEQSVRGVKVKERR